MNNIYIFNKITIIFTYVHFSELRFKLYSKLNFCCKINMLYLKFPSEYSTNWLTYTSCLFDYANMYFNTLFTIPTNYEKTKKFLNKFKSICLSVFCEF